MTDSIFTKIVSAACSAFDGTAGVLGANGALGSIGAGALPDLVPALTKCVNDVIISAREARGGVASFYSNVRTGLFDKALDLTATLLKFDRELLDKRRLAGAFSSTSDQGILDNNGTVLLTFYL